MDVGLATGRHNSSFIVNIDGKVHEVNIGRTLKLLKGSAVVFDREYTDYAWCYILDKEEITFVTRIKWNVEYIVLVRRKVSKKWLTSDQMIKITGQKAKDSPLSLHSIGTEIQIGLQYYFLTNNFELAETAIAKFYRASREIDLFVKWVKQNLKIKAFVGSSKNAFMSKTWVFTCMCLLLAFIKFSSKLNRSFQIILRLLQLNLFERKDFFHLFKGDPTDPYYFSFQQQM